MEPEQKSAEVVKKNYQLSAQKQALEEQNKLIEEKNRLLEDEQVHLERLVDERTHSLNQMGSMYDNIYRVKCVSDGMYRWHLGRALPLKDNSGTIVKWFGISTDIHEEKQAHDDLDSFIYTASHELKVPMANIQGLANALANEVIKRFDEDSELMTMIRMIKKSLDRLNSTIYDLNEISRIQRHNLKTQGVK